MFSLEDLHWFVERWIYIISVICGWMITYVKRLPIPNHEIGFASTATILAIYITNFFHMRLLTSLSSTIRNKKHSLWLIIPLLMIIAGSAGIIVRINDVQHAKPAKIDGAANEVIDILDGVVAQINDIDLSKFQWEGCEDTWKNINSTMISSASLDDKKTLETFLTVDPDFNSTEDDINKKRKSYPELAKGIEMALSTCGVNESFEWENFDKWVATTMNERKNVLNFTRGLEGTMLMIKNSSHQYLEEQMKLDFGRGRIESRLGLMKSMLVSLRADLLDSENRKNAIHSDSIENMPTKTYGVVVRTVIVGTCSFMIAISTVGIVSMILQRGEIACVNRLDDCTDWTTFVAVFAALTFLFTSFGYFGRNKCPLNADFGFKNFSSPFYYEDVKIVACPAHQSTLFEEMKKNPILSLDLIRQNLAIDENIEKMKNLLGALDDGMKALNRFGSRLKKIEELNGKLDGLKARNCTWLTDEMKLKMADHHQSLKKFFDKNSEFLILVNRMIGSMRKKEGNSKKIDDQYEDLVNTLNRSVNPLTDNIIAIDANCTSIVEKFSDVREIICNPIEQEMQNFKSIVIVFLSFCVVAVLLQIGVVRMYSYWFVDFSDESDEESDCE